MEKMEMLRQLTDQIDMEQVQDLYRRFKAGEINFVCAHFINKKARHRRACLRGGEGGI